MGSRITRAIYKNQRNAPINIEKEKAVKELIIVFICSITTIFFFLFGYLFRPHLNSSNSLAIFLILILLFSLIHLKQLNRATVFSSLLLFAVTIIAKLIGVHLMFLKAILILTTVTLASVISFQIGANEFVQALFIWLQYQFFNLGVRLSLHVQKIKMETNSGQVGRQESMLAQIMFSIIGTMVIMLAVYGSRVLRIKADQISKHMYFTQQPAIGGLNIVLLTFSLTIKRQIQHEFMPKLLNIIFSLMIVNMLHRQKIFHYAWIIVFTVSFLALFLQITTQSEPSLMVYINKAHSMSLNIMIVDTLSRWITLINFGNHRPFVVIFGYFVVIYIAQLSYCGIYLYEQFGFYLLYILSLVSYAGIILLNRFKRVDYQSVI